uniref:Uncharacterized protein n=1 Tax=Kalanchoe fedtschenkoi TaxID=63787 RepID=A0A7N0U1U4_KALFE
MHSFRATAQPGPNMYCQSPFLIRGDESSRNYSRFSDLGVLEHAAAYHPRDAVDLSPSSGVSLKSGHVAVMPNLHFGTMNANIGSLDLLEGEGQFMFQNGHSMTPENNAVVVGGGAGALVSGQLEHWGESGMVDNSQQTDTSTDLDTDDKNQYCGVQQGSLIVVDSMSKGKSGDQKALRRLAQNREAARKSRLRKKAYVQQLENSRARLAQLEQELQRARQQGMFVASGISGDYSSSVGSGALAFDMEYARWLDEHHRLINDLRSAVNSQVGDGELRILVDSIMTHYEEKFRIKCLGAKSDVFHVLSGMWKTPAERCFMWLGGFRSSEILKILGSHLEPLTDQQLMGICNLQQSSQQAEDALSQGMEALQQSLVETLSATSLGPSGTGNVADYMGQMAIAMGKLATLENFLHQADLLRQQTLQQLHRILTTRQAARALLVISDYISRLRALSSLWLARPRD